MQGSNSKIPLIAVVGPTASGKTSLSIELARVLQGEIISCDSMQIYRGMSIGTAKPDENERCGIPHYMIDVADPNTEFSCSEYARGATKCIYDISSRGKMPIFCGGTGLYLDSVLRGVRDDGAEKDPAFREEMAAFATEHGNEALHEKLREIDPESADSIHPNNVRRVIRALEVYRLTGKSKTELNILSRQNDPNFEPIVLYLTYENRDLLYERIDRRVDMMFDAGLVDEVKLLMNKGYLSENTTAGQAIGYKETVLCLRGLFTLNEAKEQIKLATRHYAKRQMTWFSAKKNYIPLEMTENGQTVISLDEAVRKALDIIKK